MFYFNSSSMHFHVHLCSYCSLIFAEVQYIIICLYHQSANHWGRCVSQFHRPIPRADGINTFATAISFTPIFPWTINQGELGMTVAATANHMQCLYWYYCYYVLTYTAYLIHTLPWVIILLEAVCNCSLVIFQVPLTYLISYIWSNQYKLLR